MADECVAVIWARAAYFNDLSVGVTKWVELFKRCGVKVVLALDNDAAATSIDGLEVIPYKPSSWKLEWLQVVDQLSRREIRYIISVLDDFYLFKSNPDLLLNQINKLISIEAKYANLNYHPDQTPFGSNKSCSFDRIHPDARYRSSLQVSLWDLNYFEWVLNQADDIWNFENVSSSRFVHYSVKKKGIYYRHLIEKGMWNYNIFRLPPLQLWKIITGSGLSYNWRQVPSYPRILVSNLLILCIGTHKTSQLRRFLRL